MKHLKKRLLCIILSILMLTGIYQPKDGCSTLFNTNQPPTDTETTIDE